jgi:trigger factor
MEIKTEKMPILVKYIVTIDEKEVDEKKEIIYKQKKPTIELPGFRKGNVPQEIAEDRIGVEKLYLSIINDVYSEVCEKEPIVSSHDFKYYGTFKKGSVFSMQFIAELKPTVSLVSFDKIKREVKAETTEFTEDDLKNAIEHEIQSASKIEDATKDVLDNLDIAVIDFEGKIVGESKPFNGGTSKNFQIRVNELRNGKKQFVGNFEDQLIGMKLNETKVVKVKFPDDYGNEALNGKDAEFVVTLKKIKVKTTPLFDDEFAKLKGCKDKDEFVELLKKDETDKKNKFIIEKNKKMFVSEIVKQSEITPVPQAMIDRENEKDWDSFLKRIGKSEEQFLKEGKISKESFFDNNSSRVVEVIKATLVLQQIAKENNIIVTEDEICQYVMRISKILDYNDERKEKILKDLKDNKRQFQQTKNSTIIEKTVDFIYEMLIK